MVRRDVGLIPLLNRPFGQTGLNPGYIKGYVPGVRENGGQYTHAAVWVAMAWARLGKPAEAWECFDLLNPVRHGDTAERAAVYKVEPYVVAADVYSVDPHTGRGGWTWYTGSAGWMYRLIMESLLGLRLEVDKLIFNPCLPAEWESFKMHYRYYSTFYHITISRKGGGIGTGVRKVMLDGVEQTDMAIPLKDDHQEHLADVEIG